MSAHPSTGSVRPVNYVFVDFENVHEVNLSVIGNKDVHFTLLLGAQQKKLDAALVEKLMEHAGSVQLVRLTSAGKNALDFATAYYVGRAVMADPGAHYHIISKDTGFDPLIEHLKNRHVRAHRHDDFTSLTFAAPVKSPASHPDDLTPRVLDHLKKIREIVRSGKRPWCRTCGLSPASLLLNPRSSNSLKILKNPGTSASMTKMRSLTIFSPQISWSRCVDACMGAKRATVTGYTLRLPKPECEICGVAQFQNACSRLGTKCAFRRGRKLGRLGEPTLPWRLHARHLMW